MVDEHEPAGTTRRTVLGTLAALAGTAGVAGATQQQLDVDPDNLVAGNRRLTITLDGISASDVQEVTVTIGEVAFAEVEVLDREPTILVVATNNLTDEAEIRDRDAVPVEVLIAAGDQEYAGRDESQVVLD